MKKGIKGIKGKEKRNEMRMRRSEASGFGMFCVNLGANPIEGF